MSYNYLTLALVLRIMACFFKMFMEPAKCRGMHNTNTEQSTSSPLLCSHRSYAFVCGAQKYYFVMQMLGKSLCEDRVVVL